MGKIIEKMCFLTKHKNNYARVCCNYDLILLMQQTILIVFIDLCNFLMRYNDSAAKQAQILISECTLSKETQDLLYRYFAKIR